MFGTLRVPRGGLSDADRQSYRSHFCTLCHCLDEFEGKLASLATNYDMTFWLLVLAALESEPPETVRRRCTALPFRQVQVRRLRPDSRALVSALTLALLGAKVEDDLHDGDRPWVKWAFLPLRPAYQRALPSLRRLGFPLETIETLGQRQRWLEQHAESLPQLAEPTADLLARAFAFLARHCQRPELEPTLSELGRALGLWIYLYDALVDRDRNRARGSFNALLRFPVEPEQLYFQLSHALRHLQQALQALPLAEARPVLLAHLDHLRRLTRREFPQLRCGDNPTLPSVCWVAGPGLLAGVSPTASAACDCDCPGCECPGCECGNCDFGGCGCDGCNGCNLPDCSCPDCNCPDCDCCTSCDFCDACDCCEVCAGLDCCCCIDESRRKKKPPAQARKLRGWPWSKKKRPEEGDGAPGPEEGAPADAADGAARPGPDSPH